MEIYGKNSQWWTQIAQMDAGQEKVTLSKHFL
jgi:hypothetical protein